MGADHNVGMCSAPGCHNEVYIHQLEKGAAIECRTSGCKNYICPRCANKDMSFCCVCEIRMLKENMNNVLHKLELTIVHE